MLLDREQGTATPLQLAAGGVDIGRLVSRGPERAYRVDLVAGSASFVAHETSRTTSIPPRFLLDQNAPNPFNGATMIRFGLPTAEKVTLTIYDVRGARIARLLERQLLPAGFHTVLWDANASNARPAANGIYIYRLDAGPTTLTRRLALLK